MWTNLWVSHPAFRAARPNRTAEGAPASCPYSMRTEPPTSLAEGLEPRVSGFLRGLAQLLGAPAPRSEVDSPTGVGFCKDRSTVSSARGIGTGTLSGPTGSTWGIHEPAGTAAPQKADGSAWHVTTLHPLRSRSPKACIPRALAETEPPTAPQQPASSRPCPWIEHYNNVRRHSALGGLPPSAACDQPVGRVHLVATCLYRRRAIGAGHPE